MSKLNILNKGIKLRNKMIFFELMVLIWNLKVYSFPQINDKFANITLKIKGKVTSNIFGNQAQYGHHFDNKYYPNKIIINNIEQDNSNNYDFDEDINIVELFWVNNDIDSCKNMFRDNPNLIEIDMSNFDMTHVTSMWCMLKNNTNLISINLSNLDTSNVKEMNGLFDNCTSLTSINLSNFDTSQVTNIEYIFSDCHNLEYINIQNFKDTNFEKFDKFFDGVLDNAVICVNKDNINKILDQLENKCYNIDCSDIWRPNQKKLINIDNTCVDDCSNTEYKYEFYGKCYKDCINSIKGKTIDICNYYFDYNDNEYKRCYKTCKTCEISSNEIIHNCNECNSEYNLLNDSFLKSKNCYPKCAFYYYVDEINEHNCIKSCYGNHNKVIEQKKKCIDKCTKDDIYIYNYNDTCLEKCPPNTKVDEEEKKCYDSCPEYKFEYNNSCLSDCPDNTYRFFIYRNIIYFSNTNC